MTNLKAIGQRLKSLREPTGASQADLAATIGVSRSTIAGIEAGSDRGGILSMIAIADYYKIPMDWLLCRALPEGGPLLGQFVEDVNELALLGFWRSLTPTERLAVTRLLRISNERTAAG